MGSISPRTHYAIDVGFEVVSTATDTQYRHNIVADGQVIAVHTIDQSGNASTSYLHSDHLGSVDAITNDSGSVIQSMSFDAFGLRRDPNNWNYDLSQNTIATLKNYTDRGYTFQEELDNVNLVDMNGRVYDPTIGRMISADPTIPAPLYSQAFNRYSYVYNSPLEYVDPSGFQTVDEWAGWNPWQHNAVSGNSFCIASFTACYGGTNIVPTLPPFENLNTISTTTNEVASPNLTLVTPPAVPTGNISPVPSGGISGLVTPMEPDCASAGGCTESFGEQQLDINRGFQVWDGVCFGCGWASSPSFDPGERNDPGNSFDAKELARKNALQGMPHSLGAATGPMHPSTLMLGTVGLPVGYARIGRRPLDGIPFELNYLELRLIFAPAGPLVSLIADYTIRPTDNLWHEQIFYNGGPNDQFNVGFFGQGLFGPGTIGPDPLLQQNPSAITQYSFSPAIYLGPGIPLQNFQNPAGFSTYYNLFFNNCQNYCNLILGGGER